MMKKGDVMRCCFARTAAEFKMMGDLEEIVVERVEDIKEKMRLFSHRVELLIIIIDE
jgi:hypothetical protein